MEIAIVGAGVTGLTAAYHLSQKGHKVVVFEKENYVGGLAAGFQPEADQGWDWSLENYFHHFFASDKVLQNLATELGLSDKLFFRQPKSSIFFDGKIYRFDSPFSVLTFPHLPFSDRLRTGLVTAYLKATNDWSARGRLRNFEEVTAVEWLIKFYGKRAYEVLWEPLLRAKFGSEADKVSMAWFWARIKKRSSHLGYIKGGFQVLIDKLVEKIKENGGEIRLGCEVKEFDYLNDRTQYDRMVFTCPAPFLNEKRYEVIWLGALNLVLVLKEQFLTDGTYWLNINEPNFPFVAVVEHTNFIDPKHYGGNYILYVGGYYPQTHRYFKMSKKEIFNEFLPFLRRINPSFQHFSNFSSLRSERFAFDESNTIQQLSAHLFAQPVIPVNYSKIIPSFKTEDPRVFRANMQMVYPWDRGVNYAIKLGQKVSGIVIE